MPITTWTDQQLQNLKANYQRQGKTDGGPFSLSAVELELLRRQPNPFGVRETAERILRLASNSPDFKTTYGEVWKSFRPDQPWKGHGSLSVMSNALGRVAAYCIDNKLPIITILVVRTGSRKLSKQAENNIFDFARSLGVETGPDPVAFAADQELRAKQLIGAQLPDA
jgi:hypothetical protein